MNDETIKKRKAFYGTLILNKSNRDVDFRQLRQRT